jgi:hypothetical protein
MKFIAFFVAILVVCREFSALVRANAEREAQEEYERWL